MTMEGVRGHGVKRRMSDLHKIPPPRSAPTHHILLFTLWGKEKNE